MSRIFAALLLLPLILSACSPGGPSPITIPSPPTVEPPASIIPSALTGGAQTEVVIPVPTTEVPPLPKLIATISTPHVDQGPDSPFTVAPSNPQDCGYQWAYQDLPELSSDFLQSIQSIQTKAQARAYAFGEDCVHADGSRIFLPMETDFEVTLPASDLTDEAALGEWIVKVMQVIENIPPARILGPRPGRVSLLFESSGERTGVNFYIDQYRALPAGLSIAEMYQTLKNRQ